MVNSLVSRWHEDGHIKSRRLRQNLHVRWRGSDLHKCAGCVSVMDLLIAISRPHQCGWLSKLSEVQLHGYVWYRCPNKNRPGFSYILLVNNLSNNVYITHVVHTTTLFTSFQIVVSNLEPKHGGAAWRWHLVVVNGRGFPFQCRTSLPTCQGQPPSLIREDPLILSLLVTYLVTSRYPQNIL